MTQTSNDSRKAEDANNRLHDLQEAVKAAQPGHDAAAFLAAIIESSDDAIISKSLSGIITTWNRGAERVFGYLAEEVVGKPITILIPEDRLDEEPAILAKIHAGQRVDHFETIRRRKDGSPIDISLTISPIRDASGKIIGASKIARDISDRKRAAEHQDLLLREMHHRVKNLFAITGSLITLAARNTQTSEELAGSMKDRLMALSRAHEMTLPSFTGDDAFREKSATLFQLLSGILAPYEGKEGDRWRLHGEDVHVTADKVTNLALLFHEFATNAAKYGCLSVPEGRLEVTVTRRGEMLELVWSEKGGRVSRRVEDQQPGFGTRLERTILQGLNGNLTREWQPSGLSIRLKIPLQSVGRPGNR